MKTSYLNRKDNMGKHLKYMNGQLYIGLQLFIWIILFGIPTLLFLYTILSAPKNYGPLESAILAESMARMKDLKNINEKLSSIQQTVDLKADKNIIMPACFRGR